MIITGLTETMFAQAVALTQNGKMKSTIHCGEDNVYILNMDNTILMRFQSPQVFEEKFSFFANDYESPRLTIEDEKVVFTTNKDGLKRTKTCPAPKTSYAEIDKLWKTFSPDKSHAVTLVRDMIQLLDDGLSHVELSKEPDAPVQLLQRDIYSGHKIVVEKSKSGAGLLDLEDESFTFQTIGIRTVDFSSLFTFTGVLTWYLQPDKNWIYFEDNEGRLAGILATCIYDELGTVNKVEA